MRSGLIQILVGAIVAYFIIVKFFSNDKDFGNLALGTQTVMYQAFDDTNFLHLVRLDDTLERNLISGWKLRGQKDVCMLLGNSQMHSINQIENGQTTYVGLLHNRYEDSVDVLGYSCPNASLQDYYLTLCYWSERLPVKYAVVPLFLDDMREEGIRHEFLSALVNSRYQLSDTTRDINNKINTDLRKAWNEQGGSSANNAIRMSEAETSVDVVEEKTPQDKTEAYLNKELDSVSKVWRNRPNVRGELFN
ncbi:MAG: hypothetical protein KDC11_10510, partial [Chitinophagaceae bacterium]|nr:hypothetical protein [Chitinophagaceae bacterium]